MMDAEGMCIFWRHHFPKVTDQGLESEGIVCYCFDIQLANFKIIFKAFERH